MATNIQILSNTNYPLADVLKSDLIESTDVRIAVAFLKKSGLNKIHDSLSYALSEKKANIEIVVGLDFKTTDSTALSALKDLENKNKNFHFYCFGDKKGNYNELVFHPKIYLFDKLVSGVKKYTSIVGSSNLTGGGLTTNFEVNSVFKEDKPKYYNQLLAIYNEIKYNDSVFCPSRDYISKYGNIQSQIDEKSNLINTDTQNEIEELQQVEQTLPGTIPTLKRLIIEFLLKQEKLGISEVQLEDIYSNIIKEINENNIYFKMDTINNSIRGELNKHEVDSKHKDNTYLFKRISKGLYSLTDKGREYAGR